MKKIAKFIVIASIFAISAGNVFAAKKEQFNRTQTNTTSNANTLNTDTSPEKRAAYDEV